MRPYEYFKHSEILQITLKVKVNRKGLNRKKNIKVNFVKHLNSYAVYNKKLGPGPGPGSGPGPGRKVGPGPGQNLVPVHH